MITRKIGKLLRGNATPVQLMMACVLGAALGFVPGFSQGPGLTAALVLLLVILNANLFVAGVAALLGKALCLLLMPVSFAVGRALLDGPTEGLFAAIVNAPVLALFGFEHYATTGGLVVGILVGVMMGLALTRLLAAFRRRMARLEEGSPRYAALSRRWWARALVFVIVGGKRKKPYEQLLQRRVGNPIRPLGVVLAVLAFALVVVLYQFASEPIVTALLARGLERANGATVDIDRARLDLNAGRLTVSGLALADPNDLGRDLLRAREVDADISAVDLLRKRVALDRLVLVEASVGEARAVRGRHVGRPPHAVDRPDVSVAEARTLEEYLQRAQAWKDRLAQVRRWLEPLSAPDEADPEARRTRAERIARRVDHAGRARVEARHLVKGAPTLAVYELVAEGVGTPYLEGETLSIHGENLSTHPHLLQRPARLTVRSSGGTIDAAARFEQPVAGDNGIELSCRGLPADAVGRQLGAVAGTPPIRGGTLDVDAAGTWTGGAAAWIDLPMSVTLHDSTLALPGVTPATVDRLVLPIGVKGPLDDPRVVIAEQALTDALVKAGADELAQRVQGVLGSQLQGAGGKEPGGQVGDAIGTGLKNLLGKDEKERAGD
jgi:uncharacterized protein (TIGR03546 family)